MKRIDAHLHLVRNLAGYNAKGRINALGDGKVVWDNGMHTQLFPKGWGNDNFLIDSALKVMDNEGIGKAVLLQGSLYGFQNYYSYQVAKKYPDRFIPAFSVDPYANDALKIVHRYVDQLGFRAAKLEISQGGGLMGYHSAFRLDLEPKWSKIFHYLADFPGFVITVDYGDYSQKSYQPEAIDHLAAMYPDLDFVVCHLSFPNADHLKRLANALSQFAPHKNIYCDLSAIQDIEKEQGTGAYPFPRCQIDVQMAKDILGAKRLMWGSDAPWSATFNSYHNLVSWLGVSGIFNEKELEDVMGNNAERIYFKKNNVLALKNSSEKE